MRKKRYICATMSEFIVSARKYRPATFRSVVGQKHITSTLQNAIEREQLAHAYLFCGPRGVGKTTCARIFAKAINCLSPSGAEACGACESCKSFDSGRSLNIHELDAASNNSVDDIRSLIEQVRIIPQLGRYSVFIIDEVHMLSTAAFNAFLKTLEEPPAHAIFILATTEKHKILPTILSRCQIYDFNRIRVEDGVEYLRYIAEQEQVTADDESLNLIAQKADGGMRDALSMFDKAVSFCGTSLDYQSVAQTLNILDYDTYFNITTLLQGGDYINALLQFDAILARGFSGQTFMSGLNRHMRDLLVAKDDNLLKILEMTGSLLDRYKAQAATCSVEFLFGAINILTEYDGKIRQSSNQRLLVELGLMKISGLGQKKNSGIGDESYPLPELKPAPQAVAPAQPVAAPTPQPSTPVPAPQVEVVAAPVEPVKAEPTPAAKPVEQPKAATVVTRASAKSSLIGGASLSDLINGTQPEPAVESTEPLEKQETQSVAIDPNSESKLEAVRTKIIEFVGQFRPRFRAAFETMEILGNKMKIYVPTSELNEEILRAKSTILLKAVEMGQINGIVELEIAINEKKTVVRPIKLEDRVAHMIKVNPLVTNLKEAFDLEVE